ncbi:ankyrin repeat and IBR domain-containing protein 1-like [Argiope bruennichi]|uniref:ankyrin repeat and IBR domain-containing protein 1-like n=1 Tax=Argiope bruennichi TaxID=94029 RepID=UPI002493D74B|nr:ankyrin repeat and IBR domain-containing protein 1-like [Argiope bruennichi]
MGSSSSKFRRYLQNGEEYAALQVFQHSLELQHSLDPNSSYGDSLKHNTPLHLAALHAMKPLLRIFLHDLKGNPNKKNAVGETPLHLVCQVDDTRPPINQDKRAACLNLLLQWRHPTNSEKKLKLDAVDNEGNTALHYAAGGGLKQCVEMLVAHGAPLFIENKSSQTVCDLAEKHKHDEIAQFLETKMLFHIKDDENIELSNDENSMPEEIISGLRAQDLQEAKDQLLVETSDMFHVPLFTAEVLLRNYEWSRQNLLEAWMKDPVSCCKEAGISPPISAVNFSPTKDSLKTCCEQIQNEYQSVTLNSPSRTVSVKEELLCDICTEDITAEGIVQVPCAHLFCRECWKVYLTAKIVDGESHNILCPAFNCSYVVPADVIENLVSADMVKRYLQFDIKAFVESNPTMKWCPYPGCARAVKLPDIEKINDEILAISFSTPPSMSHSVDCGNGHYFCWECLGEAHAPCGCEKWQEWHSKIAEIKPQELKNTYAESEEAENSLWMVTNSKPCPNCKCPIQRNEGCNHMKCSKCKYEFCWVCLESWKKHSPSTGGYFRCNRHDAVKRAEVKTEALINEAEERNKHMQELKRFLQYYTRFKNHENSYRFEQPFVKSMQDKMNVLAAAMATASVDQIDMTFLEEAIYELLRARRILCGAYVYGFYLEDNGYNKTIFEFLQSELEEATGKLSELIARTYIQTPQFKIVQMVTNVKRKRLDLLNAVHKGLIPPETPPSMRKRRKNHIPSLMGLDPVDDPFLSQAILNSLKTVDPNDPWIINQHGKHTNVAAVCDWPDFDSDDEEDSSRQSKLASILGECSREGCKRPRAKNQRTGEIHEYCSLSCKHWDILKPPEPPKVVASIDPAIENLIALELSKLQMSQGDMNDLNINNSEEISPEGINLDIPNINPDSPNNEVEESESLLPDDAVGEINTSSGNGNTEVCDTPCSDEQEIPILNDLQESNINFYLKNFDGDSKNINMEVENFSKTEKELFKVLKTDDNESIESLSNSKENIS